MQEITFSGLGTQWQILIDGDLTLETVKKEIIAIASKFESRFTRFRDDSEVGKINLQGDGTYDISAELAKILSFGLKLFQDTNGAFNPAVGTTLVAYGYDKNLNFKPDAKVSPPTGEIKFLGKTLKLKGGAKLDLGGWGKGYLIDKLYRYLLNHEIKYFLIDGGGDFRGTSKADGAPWRIALEHPLDSTMAIGVVEINHSALANSGVSKRKLGKFHHLIDPNSGNPTTGALACHVIAKQAVVADGLATSLLVCPTEMRPSLAAKYQIEYLLIDKNMAFEKSANFTGEIFTL